jgi:eukaryotic-like serine/threonine-protein kinase
MTAPPIATPWKDLEPHIDKAFELTPEECAQWLARLDTTEPALARDLRQVLAERDRIKASGFLEHSPMPPDEAADLAGATVGAYRLERRIGEGGMAEVWLASRSDGRFDGRYALKFFDPAIHSTKLGERFRQEGKILARLAHPHIARLFDAGATRDGRAYLVLEYIDGVRIDQHCASLTTEARVRLFLDVVAAVAHAHSHLVIHRDLKPSNVLVTGAGQVKLLDFGIAKLLDAAPDGDVGDRTKLSEMVLTPDYAAPEQLLGEMPATTTDVYQLGLLLYVLLTGTLPAAGSADRASRYRATLDGNLPLASERAPAADRAALRGDLDAILGMALRREPAERYPTAQAFRADLEHYLAHEPVLARRGAALYRARKFVARHRFGVAASVAGFIGVVAALGVALGQGREAAQQRDAARRELARATAANDFVTFQISVAPVEGKHFTAADLLRLSEGLVEKQFAGNDAMRAELLATIGSQHLVSQHYEEADRLFDRALQVAARTNDPALEARAACPLAILKKLNGAGEEADALIIKALSQLPGEGPYAQLRAECLTRFAEFGFVTGDPAPMIRHASEAMRLLAASGNISTVRMVDAKAVLAYGYYLAHRNREADEAFAAAIAGFKAAGMERTLLASDTYNNWALVHFRGDIRKTEPLMRRAMEIRRQAEGGDVAPTIVFNYAAVLLKLGRYDDALPYYEEAIRSAKARNDLRTTFDASMEFIELRLLRGEIDEARAQLAQVAPFTTHKRWDDLRRAQFAYYEARLSEVQGDHAGANEKYRRSVQAFDSVKEKIALNVETLCGLSRSALALGKADDAREAANRAMALAGTLAEPDVPSYLLGMALIALADVERANGNVAGSAETLRRARENLEATLGSNHELTRRAAETPAGA